MKHWLFRVATEGSDHPCTTRVRKSVKKSATTGLPACGLGVMLSVVLLSGWLSGCTTGAAQSQDGSSVAKPDDAWPTIVAKSKRPRPKATRTALPAPNRVSAGTYPAPEPTDCPKTVAEEEAESATESAESSTASPSPSTPSAKPTSPSVKPSSAPAESSPVVGETPSHAPDHIACTVERVESKGEKVIFFTFDDGPDPRWTPQILQVLAENDAHATFFELGSATKEHPELVQQVLAAGHTIGNHTYDHRELPALDDAEARQELVTGPASRCFRPPYGAVNHDVRDIATELGQAVVLWHVDPRDWERPGTDEIVDDILEGAAPGAIILLHDGGGDRSQTVEAVARALPELAKQGYEFRALDCNSAPAARARAAEVPTKPATKPASKPAAKPAGRPAGK